MFAINSGDISWMLISSAMVLFMTPGLAFFYGGMVKRKNTINTMMSSVFIMGLASLLWVLIGFSLSFSGGAGGFIGNLNWFGMRMTESTAALAYAPTTVCFAIFQMMFAIITPAIITGGIVERVRFSALFVFVAVWSVLVYYPLAHMVWGGGFLQKIGAIDFAGGAVVHISSGVSALVGSLVLGKRKNYGRTSYHPHNIPFVFLGAAILWFGWFGFNAGSAGAANSLAIHAFLTTNTASAAAMLAWIAIEKGKNGKPTLLGASTGAVVGLVSITPGAGFVPLWASILIGAAVSPICYFFISVVKPKFGYDDSLDAFGCHGIGGIWGSIATGLFAVQGFHPDPKLDAVHWNGLLFGEWKLFAVQIAAVLVTVIIAAAGTLVSLGITKLCVRELRVAPRDEDIGMDVVEHGESAYPSFNGMD
ncbi:ammonium transporter [Caproiciproducens galactitolivorans]|uniref:Ammonium transporter n=1 Tax=Caproiciproducens galactitolivorans TaxID=642589 RepID=A0A4Z0YBG5_9FIRM|nr:ammonium transporter [Caproiciproducens galactitolivorans]QEY35543.1 ammonium transporter [Caproiciproducens galactitolivorans]TGJ77268.1 ammonium transporter NrgA [Caproiciproducens galactitolivorans]